VRAGFDPGAEAERRVSFLAEYLAASGQKRLLIAVSGGVDSALAGRLSVLAVRRLREAGGDGHAVVAIRLPCGVQRDEEDARRALDWIRPDSLVSVDIEPATRLVDQGVLEAVPPSFRPGSEAESDFVRGNTKARIRMAIQYHLAGLVGGLVVGVIEQFANGHLGTKWREPVAFSVMFIVLLVRPNGLWGRKDLERV